MSLLDELTAELCAASDELPLPTLRRAVLDVRRANERLVSAARAAESGGTLQPSLARLGSAATHLENGAGLIMRAQDGVDAYVAAIGGRRIARGSVLAIAEPAEAWWARRVSQLTTESGPPSDDPARTAAELLVRVGRAVAATDRAGLHRQLVGAGAGLGSSLAGIASTALHRFAAELIGRPVAPDDLPGLRNQSSVADLLPGLPSGVVTTLMRHACHDSPAAHHDPTDVAVGAAVLAGRFAHVLGRPPEQLVHA